MLKRRYFIDLVSVCPDTAVQAKLLPSGAWIAYDDNDKRVCASNEDGSTDGMEKINNENMLFVLFWGFYLVDLLTGRLLNLNFFNFQKPRKSGAVDEWRQARGARR